MKILLTGASGLLGRAIYNELTSCSKGFKVKGTAFSRSNNALVKLDLLDQDAVQNTVSKYKPDLIIHSAAERRPDVVKADPDKAEKINVGAVETIARAASDCNAAILYMSTNYVFDGKNPPYSPESPTNPLNDYGRMKLAGEKKVAEACEKAIILRIPILYGKIEYFGESAVTIIADGLSPNKESFFDNKLQRYPTHADDVAAIIAGLSGMLAAGENISGIYQWSTEKPYTKFSMAKLMAKIIGIDPELVREASPDPNAALRPQNAKLDAGLIRALGLGSEKDFESELRKILNTV